MLVAQVAWVFGQTPTIPAWPSATHAMPNGSRYECHADLEAWEGVPEFCPAEDRIFSAQRRHREWMHKRAGGCEGVSEVKWDAGDIIFMHEAFQPEPPSWALWTEYHMHGDKCGDCGAWEAIVRPGKTQCDICPSVRIANEQIREEEERPGGAGVKSE